MKLLDYLNRVKIDSYIIIHVIENNGFKSTLFEGHVNEFIKCDINDLQFGCLGSREVIDYIIDENISVVTILY